MEELASWETRIDPNSELRTPEVKRWASLFEPSYPATYLDFISRYRLASGGWKNNLVSFGFFSIFYLLKQQFFTLRELTDS